MIDAVQQGVFPGAALLVRQAGQLLHRQAYGLRSLEPVRSPATLDTLFDLASLTKPLATTLAILLLIRDKKLHFDDRVCQFLPGFTGPQKSIVTVRHLLTHTSGLPAWRPYFERIIDKDKEEEQTRREGFLGTRQAREWVYSHIQQEPLEAAPGQHAVYSDLGFILLGALVETLTGTDFDVFCQDNIFQPLGLQTTTFIHTKTTAETPQAQPLPASLFAATERCPWRKRVVCGEVHDDNACAMGGVAGHAGVFSTVDEVDRLVSCLVDCHQGKHDFLPSGLLQECWTRDGRVPGSTWALGWDTPSMQRSSAGELFSSHSVGHLGFTGTSIWIDLERQVQVILLTNRVHPSRENTAIRDFRPRLHNAVMQAVLGKSD